MTTCLPKASSQLGLAYIFPLLLPGNPAKSHPKSNLPAAITVQKFMSSDRPYC
jgi:hypothetical protein